MDLYEAEIALTTFVKSLSKKMHENATQGYMSRA